MQKLGFDTEKLLNKSASAVNDFKYASQEMLSQLEIAYGYLVEGDVDLSIQRLQNLEVLAKESSSIARELSSDFEKHEKKVFMALDKTLKEDVQQEYQRKHILQMEENSRKKRA